MFCKKRKKYTKNKNREKQKYTKVHRIFFGRPFLCRIKIIRPSLGFESKASAFIQSRELSTRIKINVVFTNKLFVLFLRAKQENPDVFIDQQISCVLGTHQKTVSVKQTREKVPNLRKNGNDGLVLHTAY